MIRPEYLAQFPLLQRYKVAAALDRQTRLDGQYMFRWQVAEKFATDQPRIDETRGRFYHGQDGYFYDLAQITRTAAEYAVWMAHQIAPQAR
jgi:hypothetical protein